MSWINSKKKKKKFKINICGIQDDFNEWNNFAYLFERNYNRKTCEASMERSLYQYLLHMHIHFYAWSGALLLKGGEQPGESVCCGGTSKDKFRYIGAVAFLKTFW